MNSSYRGEPEAVSATPPVDSPEPEAHDSRGPGPEHAPAGQVWGPSGQTLPMKVGRVLREELGRLNARVLVVNFLVGLLPDMSFSRTRTALYRAAGVKIGPRSLIFGRISFTGSGPILARLRIGSDTMVNAHCFFDLNAEITLGDRVSVGHHVTLITADHELGPATMRAGPMTPKPITVGAGTWIAARATILPGSSIGESCVVSAGAVVSGAVPPHRVVGGSPARPLKTLPGEP